MYLLFDALRSNLQQRITTSEIENIDSDLEVDKKVRFMYELYRGYSTVKEYELLLSSLMKIHFDKCQYLDCPCKMR